MIPERLGKYEIVAPLGRGGMGEVFRARHPELGTEVAIKVLPVEIDPASRAELQERFLREARLAARIGHPGVVRVFDLDWDGNRPFMVMELVEGTTVDARLERGPLDVRGALKIAYQVARVLEEAHRLGIVHRDVKPANIALDRRGTARVLDFGIARVRERTGHLTRTGDLVGTPQYMAPEQINESPDDLDGKVDVYALSVVLYEMLTAVSPFAARDVMEVLNRIDVHVPPPPSTLRAGIPARVDRLVMRGLARDPARRSTARELRRELADLLRGDPAAPVAEEPAPGRRARPWVAVAIAGVALAGIATWIAIPGERREEAAPRAMADRSAQDAIDACRRLPAGEVRPALERAIAALEDARTGEALVQRAALRRFAGDLSRAHGDARGALALGHPAAADEALVTWLHVHKLLPSLVEDVPWLRAARPDAALDWVRRVATTRRDLAAGYEALARGEYAIAAERLGRAGEDPDSPDPIVFLALSHLLSGRPDTARELALELEGRWPGYLPLQLLLAAVSGEGEREERIALFRRAALPGAPEPGLAGALVACRRLDVEGMEAGLGAASRAGAIGTSAIWRAHLSLVWWARTSPAEGIEPDEARRLAGELSGDRGSDDPSAAAARILLALAIDPLAGVESELLALPDGPDLEFLTRWRDAILTRNVLADYCRGAALARIGKRRAARDSLAAFVRAAVREPARSGPERRELEECLASAHECLASIEIVLDGGDPERIGAELAESLRSGFPLHRWLPALVDDPRFRSRVAPALLEAARRAKAEGVGSEAVLSALALSRAAGTPWEAILEDPAWESLRSLEGFRELRGPR